MELFKPKALGSARRPTDDNQAHGNIVDQPRYARFGGLKNGAAIGTKNKMAVQKPGDGKRVI